jgi:hypothetical protein
MKYLALLSLLSLAYGCGHSNSEFDVSPDQVAKKIGGPGPAPKGMPDLDHLPKGSTKTEKMVKKGEPMPDGSAAPEDTKVVTVEMPGDKPGQKKRMVIAEAGTELHSPGK